MVRAMIAAAATAMAATLAEAECEMISDPRGYNYVECDPAKIKEAKDEISALGKAPDRKAPTKPGWAQTPEEFKANMAVENSKNDAERAAAKINADEISRAEEKRRQVELAKAKAAETNRPTPATRGNWRAKLNENKMDNKARLMLILDGAEPLPTNIRPRLPALVIVCEAGKVELYLRAETHLAGPADDLYEHRFRVKYDGGKPESLSGNKATSHDAVFFPRAAAHVERIRYAREVTIEVTPFQFAPATTKFLVVGLDQHPMDKHCRIK